MRRLARADCVFARHRARAPQFRRRSMRSRSRSDVTLRVIGPWRGREGDECLIEGPRHTHAPTRRAYGYRPGCLRLAAEVKDYQKQLELEFMSASRARRRGLATYSSISSQRVSRRAEYKAWGLAHKDVLECARACRRQAHVRGVE